MNELERARVTRITRIKEIYHGNDIMPTATYVTASTMETVSDDLPSSYSPEIQLSETMKTFINNEANGASYTTASLDSSSSLYVDNVINDFEIPSTTPSSFSSISNGLNSDDDDALTTSATDKTILNVADMSSSLQHFGWMDYCVFVFMLAICAAIGFYFGFIEKKGNAKNTKVNGKQQRRDSEALDYLVGGRKMKVLPVSLSLVASFVSGISLLGTSTEIYVYGTQYAFILITLALSGVISWYVFLPVFCNLQLTSTYEYFEMRFGTSVRLFGSILFLLGVITWLPIVIYVPALAFNQVTGINIHVVTPIVCVVCIFYTCVGGLKAVVWTDVIQTIIMIGAIIFVIIKGTIDVGGFQLVWERNYASGRIEVPEFTLDPTVRISMLSIFVGTTVYFIQVCSANQANMQRYLALPSVKHAKCACIIFTVGVILLYILTFYNGLLIYATYHDCDPLSTRLAKAKDQLVPLMVMETLGFIPGLPGLFVAGVFSAALSSLSTGLNSLSAVVLEDYVKPLRIKPLSERQVALIMRGTVVVIGTLCVLLVFVVEILGHAVLQLSMTLGSVTSGPLLGLFLLGLLVPWINTKSALTGTCVSITAMTWICIKGQMALATGELFYNEKPVTTEGCTYIFEPKSSLNHTINFNNIDSTKTFSQYVYHMSFTYYVAVGCLISMISAGLSTFFFGLNNPSDLNIKLFAPCIRRFIKPQYYQAVCINEHQTYFEMRFGKALRYFCSILFVVGLILYLPVAIYVPALTFNQVSGINVHIITPIVCLICTFYTCVGGLKAVVWTDAVQSFVMYGTVFTICIKGTIDLGGLQVVLERNWQGGRLRLPDLTMDPTVRLSLSAVIIGGTLHKIQSSDINQISIQRFLSLSNMKKVKQTMFIFTSLLLLLLLCCCYIGLLTYATYHDCDPLSTKLAKAHDQLPTILIMRILGVAPGLPGLFVAGVFSAALSSLSTGLNSLACVLSEDLIKPFLKQPLTERQTAILLRSIVALTGLICMGLVFIVERMGTVLQLSVTMGAITMGPLLGFYICGICLPWINQKSAAVGGVVSFLTLGWICLMAQYRQMHHTLRHPKLPVSIDGCLYAYDNITAWESVHNYEPSSRDIYHLSFMWYTAFGGIVCVLTALLASFIFGSTHMKDVDPALITPLLRGYIRRSTMGKSDSPMKELNGKQIEEQQPLNAITF